MKSRQARKILRMRISNKMRKHLYKLYPPIITEDGYTSQSWHKYYRISMAWIVVSKQIRKYGDKFKKL